MSRKLSPAVPDVAIGSLSPLIYAIRDRLLADWSFRETAPIGTHTRYRFSSPPSA
jgi:hypothetical protein